MYLFQHVSACACIWLFLKSRDLGGHLGRYPCLLTQVPEQPLVTVQGHQHPAGPARCHPPGSATKGCWRWISPREKHVYQSCHALTVAHGRLSHSWKCRADTEQQDRPVRSRGERFCYRPARGLVQAEKGWQTLAVYFCSYGQ